MDEAGVVEVAGGDADDADEWLRCANIGTFIPTSTWSSSRPKTNSLHEIAQTTAI
jgi:hypothetical protein